MILLNLVQHLTLADVTSWQIGHGLLSGMGHWDMSHLAALFNTDVFAGVRTFFNNFLKSGQAWALAIGVIFGYIFRALTTYG
jgi:hypothetical protein